MFDSLASLAGRLEFATPQLPSDGRKSAAVAVVLHGTDLLLMKRAERASDPWSGHVSLPGGRHEPDDPHLLATAIREAREELGIELEHARMLGSLPTLHPYAAGPKGLEVTPFVFAALHAPATRTSAEAQAVFWLPLAEVVAGRLDSTFVHAESAVTFPSWEYQGFIIWGLTMRIVRDLIDRMPFAESRAAG
jgi:8-oxo-dGTP pyrophosphatase MutT (NUDIX family)